MTFKTGDDPNRYTQSQGVMAFHADVAAKIRGRCMSVVDFLFDTVENEGNPLKLRIVAAKECLNRGLGVPITTTVHLDMGKEGEMKDVSTLTDAELEALARRISTTPTPTPKDQENTIIDGEYS